MDIKDLPFSIKTEKELRKLSKEELEIERFKQMANWAFVWMKRGEK